MADFMRDYGFSSVSDEAESGWTPLRFAVIRRDGPLAEALVKAGANVDCKVRGEALAVMRVRCSRISEVVPGCSRALGGASRVLQGVLRIA